MERRKVAIIGVGLMGGSMALRLHEKKIASQLIGVESNEKHAALALELELVDKIMRLDEAVKQSDVVILCIPVDQILEQLPGILDLAEHQIILDLGSTKGEIIEQVKNHPNRKRFVPTHPMWGTEFSGPRSARRDAFLEKAAIICNEHESDPDAVSWVKYMYEKIGMHVLMMEAEAHDLHAAYVSHISHITSFALANTVLQKEKEEVAIFEMASSGFESTVRLAKSHPSMWVPIFLQNRKYILDVLDEHLGQLIKFKKFLADADREGLQGLIDSANTIRRILK